MNVLKKRGMSPLVASVILVGLVVSLGALLIDWTTFFVKDTTNYAEKNYDNTMTCKMDVNLEVLSIDGVRQICSNATNNYLEVVLENKGIVDIDGVEITVITTDQQINITKFHDFLIPKAGPRRLNITYASGIVGNISLIKFTPLVKFDEDVVVCVDKIYTLSGGYIRSCDVMG